MESSLQSTSNVHEIEPELQPHMDINSDGQYGLTLVKDTTRKRHLNSEGFFILFYLLTFSNFSEKYISQIEQNR